jgi:cyanophycinase
MGTLLLEGGAEFGGKMREPDLKAIDLAGGFDAPIRIIPTAAAPDHNDRNAGNNGVRWFQSLGAKNVISVPLIDKASANDDEIVRSLQRAKLIYLLGGFPDYLGQTLKETRAWNAAIDAYQNGAVLAGSSAGAMVMCQYYYDPERGRVHEGLNLLPRALMLPHHNTFGKSWVPQLTNELPNVILIGIDEQTGMLDAESHTWTVYGKGAVTLYSAGKQSVIQAGDSFSL